ncbi:MAG: energy-coupling factor transporter transmembrane protein EcfT [Clostridiales bacterium]|nr:energy-coupling factor transporter transmembrane protein EcfT [Clostridiales bacterium]
MLNNISLGRYYPARSFLHDTDPRVKTILYAVYLAAIFMIREPVSIAILAGIVILLLILAKITPGILWSTVKPILPLALFIFVINIFTIKEGNVLFSWKIITVTDYGAGRAAIMAVRLIFLIIATSVLLTLTTTPLKMSDALEKLFAPLSVIKIPVHEMAMMMSIALRFIPTLATETDKIMKAQQSRGADYDTGSFINKVRGYITVLIPLFVSSFRRADELAVAMDARCYRGGKGRTKLNPLNLTLKDVLTGILFTLLAALVVFVDISLR